jgi:putative ABC transport system permease protein
MKMQNTKVKVIGVVKDFHNESFRTNISSLALWYVPGYSYNLNIRIGGNNVPGTIQFINGEWEKLAPDIPFEYQFLDKKYDALYKDEDKLSLVIGYFSIIAILIACLGLFGLVTFLTERRTKEIGIRKVNGAKVSEILAMLNRIFVKWVVIAFVVASPIAWYAMHKWLENFAYKSDLNWWIFALSGLLALGIALLTVSWQSWRAATRNPVEALRYE